MLLKNPRDGWSLWFSAEISFSNPIYNLLYGHWLHPNRCNSALDSLNHVSPSIYGHWWLSSLALIYLVNLLNWDFGKQVNMSWLKRCNIAPWIMQRVISPQFIDLMQFKWWFCFSFSLLRLDSTLRNAGMGFCKPFFDCSLCCLRHRLEEDTAYDVYVRVIWFQMTLNAFAILN